jgi:hypothetical protein
MTAKQAEHEAMLKDTRRKEEQRNATVIFHGGYIFSAGIKRTTSSVNISTFPEEVPRVILK